VNLHERAVCYYCIMALLLGAQALLAGLLAELIVSRTSATTPVFSIAEHVSGDRSNEGSSDHDA